MARPQKNNADYFSHDSSMRNDMKIKALRRKYGIEGYGLYCMLLEIIAGSDHFEYIIPEDDHIAWEMFAGDVDIDPELLREIIVYMSTLWLLHYESWKIFSDWLKKRLQPVVEKRDRLRGSYTSVKTAETPIIDVSDIQNPLSTVVSATETLVSATEMPQRKVKETKVNEKKEQTQVPACVPFSFLDVFWNQYPKQTNQLQAEDAFYSLTNEEKSAMIAKLPQWLTYWQTIEVRFVPSPDKFLSGKKWRDDIPKVYQKKSTPLPVPRAPEIPESSNGKEDIEKIWQYFLSLDDEYRSSIEKKASDKFAHSVIRNPEPLIKAEIIIAIRPEYEKQKSQQ